MTELTMEQRLRNRIAELHTVAPGSIGDVLRFELESCDEEKKEYVLRCITQSWMRNAAGTLHGGMCATLVDQAMGFVSYCLMPGPGVIPTIELQVSYHRPLIPGEDVLIRIREVAVTRSLVSLAAEAVLESAPEKLCISSSATYFYKPAKE